MKLVRYGEAGSERPGVVDRNGRIRDLSAQVADVAGDTLGEPSLDRLRALDPETLPLVEGNPRLGPPVAGVRKFIGVGLNYADHAAETGARVPREPVLFTKAISCICGPNDDVILPPDAEKGDWEVELAVVIGKTARRVAEDGVMGYIAGYTLCNDVSERHYQVEGTGQWLKGKSADTFGPIGPWLVTRDEIADPQNLSMFCNINGERMQTGSTATMIFSVAHIVAFTSRFMTLEPGDIITTGTPPGVGMARKPPRFLRPGDEMHLGVDGLGEQRQKVLRATS